LIKLTKINNDEFFLNAEIIENIEEKPHTLIKTTNDKTYVVKESANEVVKLIINYRKEIGINREVE
jgi:flagellar protein FlbD